jgi:processive 1,2-diacylglycerol beta-glucosyltransferase
MVTPARERGQPRCRSLDSPPRREGRIQVVDTTRPILVTYVSAGGGHRVAAEAITEALRDEGWTGEIELVDLLALTPDWLRKAYGDGYLWTVQRLPHIWRAAYEWHEDLKNLKPASPVVKGLRWWMADDFRRHIRRRHPAAVLSAHFLCTAVLSDLRRAGRLDAWTATVTTDFTTHSIWLEPGMDAYIVPNRAQRSEMLPVCDFLRLQPEQIHVTGIPIRRAFRDHPTGAAIHQRLDLRSGVPTVVMMAASQRLGHIVRILQGLLALQRPLDLVVIVGKNRRMKRTLEAFSGGEELRLRVLAHVDWIHELFAAADLVVGKAGGLTTSECLACGTPMVIFKPYTGQEERNADFLLERGVAVRASQPFSVPPRIDELLAEPERLGAMREACRRLARPEAAISIARIVLEGIRSRLEEETRAAGPPSGA